MRKHVLPLTYAPKIPAVLDGRCTQTIRAGRKFKTGDLVMFHGWEGLPYRSKWSFRTPYFKIHTVWGGSGNRFRRLLPTPKADDGRRGKTIRGIYAPGDGLTNLDQGDGKPIGCRLNPEWIESLMGLPTGWTDCDASGTRLSRNRCTQFLRGLHKLRTVYRSR